MIIQQAQQFQTANHLHRQHPRLLLRIQRTLPTRICLLILLSMLQRALPLQANQEHRHKHHHPQVIQGNQKLQ